MANEIKLEVYTFKIRKKKESDYEELDALYGKNDTFTYLANFIDAYAKMKVDEDQKRSLQFDSNKIKINTGNRTISGIVESGDYGSSSTIKDRKTQLVQYEKRVDDLDIKPFYYLLYIPKKRKTGIIILQRSGIFGIATIFKKYVYDYFSINHGDIAVDFASYLPKDLPNTLLGKKSITQLKIRRYNLPQDIADRFGIKNKEDISSVELRILAARTKTLKLEPRIRKFLKNGNTAFYDIPEMSRLGFDQYSEPSVIVGTGRNARTIDLSDTLKIRPYYDIDDQIIKFNGHPTLESIDTISQELLNQILIEMGYETN